MKGEGSKALAVPRAGRKQRERMDKKTFMLRHEPNPYVDDPIRTQVTEAEVKHAFRGAGACTVMRCTESEYRAMALGVWDSAMLVRFVPITDMPGSQFVDHFNAAQTRSAQFCNHLVVFFERLFIHLAGSPAKSELLKSLLAARSAPDRKDPLHVAAHALMHIERVAEERAVAAVAAFVKAFDAELDQMTIESIISRLISDETAERSAFVDEIVDMTRRVHAAVCQS